MEQQMNKTAIEYLDYTYNPIAMRCTPVGPGCANCWHLTMADRLAANPSIPKEQREAYAGGPPVLVESRLNAPLRRKKPARIGTQFMGDLFHEDVPNDFRTQIYDVMACAEEQVFLVLTKRPENIRHWEWWVSEYWPGDSAYGVTMDVYGLIPNIHLGVSASTQRDVDQNVPILLQTPAAVRLLSLEPMLEELEIARYLDPNRCYHCGHHAESHQYYGPIGDTACGLCECLTMQWPLSTQRIHQVIIGCESGPHRRPMKLEWAIDVVQQCQDANVPVFVKQIHLDGKVSHNPAEWPEELQRREYP